MINQSGNANCAAQPEIYPLGLITEQLEVPAKELFKINLFRIYHR
ncbi:MAG: hypothetical protein AVDCRST_MAG95-461 [uncultured Adhaeribacter sp.]|uniref:Uncharacterized protein n=1 Tax=uncultured Adhaeribacter sp. TaxID=448109 RepID=A0A6J4HAN0_9BACT|nr:MAG: hypothetical protein AVDCRST_MAG95-461 [uncultured Adhaeribacter sp.]